MKFASARGSSLQRRRIIKGIVALCLLFILVNFCSSCKDDSKEVRRYLELAKRILSRLTTRLVGLRDALSLPIEKQADVDKKLILFRKSISQSRREIDSAQTPALCMTLEELLRKCAGEATDISNVSDQFVDYLKSAGRVARDLSSLVSEVLNLKNDDTSYAVVTGLEDKANRLSAEARSVIVSDMFSSAHEIFTAYAADFAEAVSRTTETVRKIYYGSAGSTQGAQKNGGSSGVDYKGIFGGLKAVAKKWQSCLDEISGIIEGLKDPTGYKKENAEFDASVISTQAEIGRLEEELKKSNRKS